MRVMTYEERMAYIAGLKMLYTPIARTPVFGQSEVEAIIPLERKFNLFNCPNCGKEGEVVRKVDTLRQCPWSIIAFMRCHMGTTWATYIRDESRMTPYDVEDEDE